MKQTNACQNNQKQNFVNWKLGKKFTQCRPELKEKIFTSVLSGNHGPGPSDRDQTFPDYVFLCLHNLGLKSQKSSLIQSVVTAVMTQAAALMRLPDFQAGLEPIGSLKR